MIPKIIHYCWFGGKPKPELAVKCINSWKKYCPDYKIVEWNEDNFDINCCDYVRDAFKEKKWAFITDYVRLFALVNQGGIYMDTDVEVVKPLDKYLSHTAFSGFQTEDSIQTGLLACEKGYQGFKDLLDEYSARSFYKPDGTLNDTPNPVYFTDYYMKKGLKLNNHKQKVAGFALYPIDYFCAKSYLSGKIERTKNTVTIHHFAGSWFDEKTLKRSKAQHFCYSHLGIFAGAGFFVYRLFAALTDPQKLRSVIRNRLKK